MAEGSFGLGLISAMSVFVYFCNYGVLKSLSALEFQVFVCLTPTHVCHLCFNIADGAALFLLCRAVFDAELVART